jgi:hypothetical protein
MGRNYQAVSTPLGSSVAHGGNPQDRADSPITNHQIKSTLPHHRQLPEVPG